MLRKNSILILILLTFSCTNSITNNSLELDQVINNNEKVVESINISSKILSNESDIKKEVTSEIPDITTTPLPSLIPVDNYVFPSTTYSADTNIISSPLKGFPPGPNMTPVPSSIPIYIPPTPSPKHTRDPETLKKFQIICSTGMPGIIRVNYKKEYKIRYNYKTRNIESLNPEDSNKIMNILNKYGYKYGSSNNLNAINPLGTFDITGKTIECDEECINNIDEQAHQKNVISPNDRHYYHVDKNSDLIKLAKELSDLPFVSYAGSMVRVNPPELTITCRDIGIPIRSSDM